MIDIDRIRARYNAWYSGDLGTFGPGVNFDDSDAWAATQSENVMAFEIVREDVPALLAEVESLRTSLAFEVERLTEARDAWQAHFEATRDSRDLWRAEAEHLRAELKKEQQYRFLAETTDDTEETR